MSFTNVIKKTCYFSQFGVKLIYDHNIQTTHHGGIMLGYELSDQEDMVVAIQSAITTVDFNNDPWLYDNLKKAESFLQGLWAEGYFD